MKYETMMKYHFHCWNGNINGFLKVSGSQIHYMIYLTSSKQNYPFPASVSMEINLPQTKPDGTTGYVVLIPKNSSKKLRMMAYWIVIECQLSGYSYLVSAVYSKAVLIVVLSNCDG